MGRHFDYLCLVVGGVLSASGQSSPSHSTPVQYSTAPEHPQEHQLCIQACQPNTHTMPTKGITSLYPFLAKGLSIESFLGTINISKQTMIVTQHFQLARLEKQQQ